MGSRRSLIVTTGIRLARRHCGSTSVRGRNSDNRLIEESLIGNHHRRCVSLEGSLPDWERRGQNMPGRLKSGAALRDNARARRAQRNVALRWVAALV
jgi:hypothetical protein